MTFGLALTDQEQRPIFYEPTLSEILVKHEAVNKGQLFVKLTPKHARKRSQQQFETAMRLELARFKGVTARVTPVGMGPAGAAPIQINLKGPELARLKEISDLAATSLRDVPGLVGLRSSLEGRKPEVILDVDRNLAADVGLSIGSIGAALRPVLAGEKAGDWEDETGLSHDVIVRLARATRASEADLARIPVASSRIDPHTGAPVMVPLGQVARIRTSGAPSEIRRLGLERVVQLEGNYENRPLTESSRHFMCILIIFQ